jgi:hypothetical protein
VRGTRTVELPNDTGFVSHEDLGNGSIEGLDSVSTNITTTYNPVFLEMTTHSMSNESFGIARNWESTCFPR